jgi:AraC-like DNA-binding protein
MDYAIRRPTGLLARYVKHLWSMDLRLRPGEVVRERVAPNGCVCVMLNFGERPQVVGANGDRTRQPWAHVSGQKTTFTDLEARGRVGLLGVVLRPEAGAAVLGLPASELRGLHVALRELFGADADPLSERVGEAQSHGARFDAVEAVLGARLARTDPPVDRCMQLFVRRVSQSGGTRPVAALAAELGLSRRQLERKVAAAVGLPPKAFSRMIRYQRALALKQRDPALGLTRLAYDAGYADQAHFIREFRAITGYTPRQAFALCPPVSDYYGLP